MRLLATIAAILCFGFAAVASSEERIQSPQDPPRDLSDPCAFNGKVKLNPSERVGCEIWFKATAGTYRFFTYVYQQRLGVLIDWYRVLKAPSRDTRFNEWGLINDPACCKPGDPDCPAKNIGETYGFDYCPGDDALLSYVGKRGYKDPACGLNDVTPDLKEIEKGERFPKELWQSSCDLEFGTSAGAMGYRKFPNPKFDKTAWESLNHGLDTWDGFRTKLSDGSIEPPFLIGMSCGACHIAFDPLKPFKAPYSPSHPAVENLSGTVGNQYSRVLPIFVSGMPEDSLEWQVFALVRPGTVDTSAIPTDQVNNTGTMNALLNLRQRPTFPHDVRKWRPVKSGAQCAVNSDQEQCWCEPGKDNKKCWKRSLIKQEQVHNILKGGEDSIGVLEALQRVYLNIGSCAEAAWVNHLTDMMQVDSHQRGYGQTPTDIGQARRDCPNFRAIEDRLPDLLNYLMTGAPTDLREAMENERKAKDPNARYTEADLVKDLETDLHANVERGRQIFAHKCASCHSSLPENEKNGKFIDRDFRALDPATSLRKDWLGNDAPTTVTKLEVNASRALHSNHMKGHLWEEFSSESYRNRKKVDLPMSMDSKQVNKITADGGRGYYRNISLLSVWAYAPFTHNNGIGPELCRAPKEPPDCKPFDPSVEGRYQLFKKSMYQLLHPDKRSLKITLTTKAKHIGPLGMELKFPNGKPAALIGNFRHKEFINDFEAFLKECLDDPKLDLQKAEADPEQFKNDLQKALDDPGRFQTLRAKGVLQRFGEILVNPKDLLEKAHELSPVYSNSLDLDENKGSQEGHPLFELLNDSLLEQNKLDLTAFLATL